MLGKGFVFPQQQRPGRRYSVRLAGFLVRISHIMKSNTVF